MGSLVHVDAPELHLQLVKGVTLRGEPGNGSFLEAGIDHDVKTSNSYPLITLEHDLTPTRRLVATNAKMPSAATKRVFFGQQLNVDLRKRFGFEHVTLRTELQAGVDVDHRRPHYTLALDSYSVRPLWHPAVVAGAGALYCAMRKFRNMLPVTFTAAKIPVRGGKRMEIALATHVQRLDENLLTTLTMKSMFLTLHL